jgi:hypothetical protein
MVRETIFREKNRPCLGRVVILRHCQPDESPAAFGSFAGSLRDLTTAFRWPPYRDASAFKVTAIRLRTITRAERWAEVNIKLWPPSVGGDL